MAGIESYYLKFNILWLPPVKRMVLTGSGFTVSLQYSHLGFQPPTRTDNIWNVHCFPCVGKCTLHGQNFFFSSFLSLATLLLIPNHILICFLKVGVKYQKLWKANLQTKQIHIHHANVLVLALVIWNSFEGCGYIYLGLSGGKWVIVSSRYTINTSCDHILEVSGHCSIKLVAFPL